MSHGAGIRMRLRKLLATTLFAVLGAAGGAITPAASPAAAASTASAERPDYLYRTLPRDTLIGLGRRLLTVPQRWHELQKYNAITRPNRVPTGTLLRIPREWMRQRSEAAEVAVVVGEASADGVPLQAGQSLPEGAHIVTAAGGYATLRLADGSVVTLNPGGSLELERLHQYPATGVRDTELKLGAGSLETHVQPQGEAGRFQIRTPVAISAVRGTEFRRAVIGDGARDKTEVLGGAVAVAGAAAGTGAAAGPGAGVVVPADFGAIADASGGPHPPVRLLPAPDLASLPARFEDEALGVTWPAVTGARGYRAQLAADADFRKVVAEKLAAAASVTFEAVADGHYWLRVRAIDADGLEGSDAVHSVERHRLPAAPLALEPRAEAFLTGGAATFRWTAPEGADSYRMQLARDAQFGDLVVERDRIHAVELRLEPIEAGSYYWRLASRNVAGESGQWGAVQHYTQKLLPSALAEPVVAGHAVSIAWPGLPGQHYVVQFARDRSFTQVLEEQHVEVPHASFARRSPGPWYVRVRTIDPDGYSGPFSPWQRFVVPFPWWVKAAPLLLIIPFL